MPLSYNPLTDEHCQICDRILSTIQEPLDVANACIECGFPAEDLRDQLVRIRDTATKLKATFFPHRP